MFGVERFGALKFENPLRTISAPGKSRSDGPGMVRSSVGVLYTTLSA